MHQSSDWCIFHTPLRERSFRAGRARPKSPEFGMNSGRFGLDADCSASEGAKLCEAFVWPEMARRHFSANKVSRPVAKRPGDEGRRFAARKEMHQSSDWCIFHTPLREKCFRAGRARPKSPEFGANSGRFGLGADLFPSAGEFCLQAPEEAAQGQYQQAGGEVAGGV